MTDKKKSLPDKFIKKNRFLNITFDWLKNVGVRKELESYIFAAQEQTIPTKNYKTNIMKMNISASCRIYSCPPERIQHILSTCPVLAKQTYTERHNIIGKNIHQAY